jgi:hypothetical protein
VNNSRRKILIVVASLAMTLGFGLGEANARPSRPGQIPNGTVLSCANCHVNPGGGGQRNVFGQAIENGFLNGSGFSATVNWNATIAAADSDGDGVTNGTELGDPDGDGTPDPGATVTNPGDATSFAVQQPPAGDPNMPPIPPAGGDPNMPPIPPAGGDPNMPPMPPAGGDPNMPPIPPAGGDPNMPPMPPAGGDPNMPPMPPAGGDPNMPPMPPAGGGGFEGEQLFEGEVVSINHEDRIFEVELDDGSVETVQVDEATEFVIRLEGDTGFGPPPGDGYGFSTFGQFDDPNFDSGGGDPFQGIAFFEDMEEGDFVEVFGEEQDDGTSLATGIKIIRDFAGGGGGFADFSVAYGHVVGIDVGGGVFEIEEAPGLRNTVQVADETIFEVETFTFFDAEPFPGDEITSFKRAARKTTTRRQFQDGYGFEDGPGPNIRTVTFADLEIDDDTDIFGSFNDDGSIAATRVRIFRGDEPPEPDLFGHVDDINFDERTITISGDDDEPVTVQLTDETFIGLVYGNFGGDDPFQNEGPEPGQFDGNGANFKPAAKQATRDDFIEPPPGVFFDEFRKFEDIQITMTVAIYLVDDQADVLEASAIVILNGGARQRGFEVAARIEFVDQFGGLLFFQPPFGVQVPAGTPITMGSGESVTTLRELRDALVSVQTFRFEPRFLRIFAGDGPEPDILIATEIQVVPLGDDLFQGTEDIFARIDDVFGQIVDHEGLIYPSPPSPVRFNRNTFFGDVDGNGIDIHDLVPGALVAVEGLENIFPGEFEGERIAEFVTLIGGQPFEFDGLVESVDTDAGSFNLQVDDPEPINDRAYFGGFFGEQLSPEEFIEQFGARDGAQVVVQFNPFGPGIVRLQLHDPESPRSFKPDEEVFEQFEVDVVDVDAGGFALVFNPLPPFTLSDGAILRDGEGNDIALAELLGNNVFIEGEVLGEQPVVFFAKGFNAVDEVEIVLEIGDFDDEGVENDVILRVLDVDGNEVDGDVNVFLDFFPPVTVQSGAIAFNQGPGLHRVEVEVPSLGLFAETEFIIRGRGAGFGVDTVFPEDEATGVAEDTEVRITFTAPIQQAGNFVNAQVFLRPGFGGEPLHGLRLEDDGFTLVIPVELEPNTSYTLAVASALSRSDQTLNEPVVVTFSTGEVLEAFGRVSGSIALVEALTKQAEGSEILFGEVFAVDSDDDQAAKAVVAEDGTFGISGLPEGDYRLFAKVETTTGTTSGGFDSDGDGEPDPVSVVGGETTELGAFALPRPIASTEASIVSDVASPVTVDFNASGGDDGQSTTTVPPGESFQIAVYVNGVVDLVGFELQVDYDSTAVTLESISDDGGTELNLLRLRGGIAVSITTPRGGAITQATAMLGGIQSQWGQGDGLLSIMSFTVNERFSGNTDVVVTQAKLSNGAGGTETVQTFTRGSITVEGLDKQLALVASADSIDSDGSASSTLTATLSDLDGLALTDDDSTEVTFTVSGDGLVDGASSKTLAVTNGSASVVLTAQTEGNIVITASVSGAREATVTVVGKGQAPVGEGEIGPVSLDFDATAGDQEQRILETVPEDGLITLDLVLNEGGSGLSGYQASVTFDATVVEYVSAAPAGLFDGGLMIPTASTGLLLLSTVFLGATTTTEASGSVATMTFRVIDGATLPTRITASALTTAVGSDQTRLTLSSGGSVVQVGTDDSGPATPDFDGDGAVGFSDFLAFAGAFGKTSDDADFDARFDLDGDDSVGFSDFIAFASAFGTSVKPALTKAAMGAGNANATVSLVATPVKGSSIVDVSIGLEDVSLVAGYQVQFSYDETLLEMLSAKSSVASWFSSDDTPGLFVAGRGRAISADVLKEPIAGAGDILNVQFRLLDPTVSASIELLNVEISDPAGRITTLRSDQIAELRSMPDRFELSQNYPNPFNPETVIPFSVPESGVLRLSIFNILGQEVAVLVDESIQAGFHRVAWNGKDQFNRSVASGLYFVRMHSDVFTSVRKMMFLK